MEDQTKAAYKVLRNDLLQESKKHKELENFIVGDTHMKDFVIDDEKFKFKIYVRGKGHVLSRDETAIEDYPKLPPKEKENFIKKIIEDIKKNL